jgi:hypothetical protein
LATFIHGGGRINASQLAEIVNGVAAVPCAAADSAEKQTPSFRTQTNQPHDHPVNYVQIEFLHDLNGFAEILPQPVTAFSAHMAYSFVR